VERLRDHGVGIPRCGAPQRFVEENLPAKDRGGRGGEEGEENSHLHAEPRARPRRRLPGIPGQEQAEPPYRFWTRKCVRTASPGVSIAFSSFIVSVS
jgi:hypothetical protein